MVRGRSRVFQVALLCLAIGLATPNCAVAQTTSGREIILVAMVRREFPDVLGWQPLILNQSRCCSDCQDDIAVGDRAFVGLAPGGLSAHVLCSQCMDERQ